MKAIRHQIYKEEKLDDAKEWIKVCVVLHNMMIEEPEDRPFVRKVIREMNREKARKAQNQTVVYSDDKDSPTGTQRRKALCDYLIARNCNNRH